MCYVVDWMLFVSSFCLISYRNGMWERAVDNLPTYVRSNPLRSALSGLATLRSDSCSILPVPSFCLLISFLPILSVISFMVFRIPLDRLWAFTRLCCLWAFHRWALIVLLVIQPFSTNIWRCTEITTCSGLIPILPKVSDSLPKSSHVVMIESVASA